MPEINSQDQERASKLMEGIGRCIYIYQRIELLLKILLPHMVDPTTDTQHQLSPNWGSLLDSKQTLGPLIKQFSEKSNTDEPNGFEGYLRKLVDERNELVHHFFSIGSEQIRTTSDVENMIVDLRGRMNFAKPFMYALEDAAQNFAAALEVSVLEDEKSSIQSD